MATLIKVKVGEKVYQLDRLTLGDSVVLKRKFGVDDLDNVVPSDPETMLGLITLAIAKSDGLSIDEALVVAEDVSFEDFENIEPEVDPDPLEDAAAEGTSSPAKGGGSAKRPKKPGTPR